MLFNYIFEWFVGFFGLRGDRGFDGSLGFLGFDGRFGELGF